MNDGFDSLLNQLEELGFYAYTDPTLIAEAKNRAKGVDFPYDDLTNRFYPADAEDLAEGGVLDFVQDVRLFLEIQGVKLATMDEDFSLGGAYSVRINGATHEIYSKAEEEDMEIDLWGITAARAFAMINSLLQSAQSRERIYALYDRNDLFGVFLTPEMQLLIWNSHFIPKTEKPYTLTLYKE